MSGAITEQVTGHIALFVDYFKLDATFWGVAQASDLVTAEQRDNIATRQGIDLIQQNIA